MNLFIFKYYLKYIPKQVLAASMYAIYFMTFSDEVCNSSIRFIIGGHWVPFTSKDAEFQQTDILWMRFRV